MIYMQLRYLVCAQVEYASISSKKELRSCSLGPSQKHKACQRFTYPQTYYKLGCSVVA